MKKNIILIILFIYVVLIFADDREDIFTFKPHYQSYNDSVWLPNTTAYDFISAFSYNDNIYFALNGGIGKYNQDSLMVYPYPLYGKLKGSIRSVIQINNELWVAIRNDGIGIFDMNINSFIRKLEIEDESNFERPFSNINMKYDKEYNTVWISTNNGLYSFNINKEELINRTQKYKELINNRIYNHTPIIIDKENIWIISNSDPGSLLSYNKSNGKWIVFRDELVGFESTERIHMFAVITTPNFLWLDVRGNKKFGHVVEYNKENKTWKIYEYSELSEMINRLIKELPNIEIFSHTSGSFPKSYLENYKKYYRETIKNPDDFKEYKEYYVGYDENVIDDMLEKINSIKDIEIFSAEFIKYNNKIDFTYKNQLVFHDENGYIISTKQNYLDEIIEYLYPLIQHDDEVILISNKGLSLLDLKSYSLSVFKKTKNLRLGPQETNFFYIKASNHLYIFQVVYGHGRKYFIYDYDMGNHIFKEITPDFEFSFKQKYFWKFRNKLFMLRRHDLKVLKFQNDEWIEVKEKNEPEKLIQPLSKELILNDGRKLLIDFSGLKIFN